jgi:hypothetical protein
MTGTPSSSQFSDLSERLTRLAEQPAPPQKIDVVSAKRVVRRVRRLRKAGTVAGCAATVAAVAILVPVVASGSGGGSPASDDGSPRPVQTPAPLTTIPQASFGWLPSGYTLKRVIVDDQNDVPSLEQYASGSSAAGGGAVTLTVYPRGPEPDLGYFSGAVPAKRLPAAPVKGNHAYWITKPGSTYSQGAELRWHYGTSGWADLQVSGPPGRDTATVYKIAESVAFASTAAPLRFPVRISGLPSALHPVRTMLNTGANLDVGFNFQIAGSPSATASQAQANWLSISLSRPPSTYSNMLKTQAPPNTTIAGHPAWDSLLTHNPATQHATPRPEAVSIYNFNGYLLNISAGPGVLQLLRPTGGLTALIQHITVLPRSRSAWTATPFE